jgi:ribonuclease P protein component
MSERQRSDREATKEFGMPRALILRGRTTFATLFADGRSLRSGSLVLKVRVVGTGESPAVITAFIVPKRHGRAVDRNRVRRLIREIWRHERPGFLATLDRPLQIHLGLIWSGPTAATRRPTHAEIGADLRKGLVRLRRHLSIEDSTSSDR